MKNKDFLNILGDIDAELIEDAAPNFEKTSAPARKKRNMGWVKYAAIAACCALILSGVMIAEPLFDMINSPNVEETFSEVGGSAQSTVEGNGMPIESGDKDPDVDVFPEYPGYNENRPSNGDIDEMTFVVSGEEMTECEEPDYYFLGTIFDEKYSGFDLLQTVCSYENVGEGVGETTVVFYDENGIRYDVKAEVNKVVGIDGNIALCLRYLKEDKNEDINSFLQFDKYWYLSIDDYKFSSFAEMRDSYWSGIITKISSNPTYFKNTEEDYCKYFQLKANEIQTLTQLLLKLDAEAVDLEGGAKPERICAECGEMVSFYCFGFLEDFTGAKLEIYDSGYLFTDVLGGQLFNIGQEAARNIIDIIIKNGEPQGYVWNDQEEKWYPVFKDEAAQYSTFKEALEENKLMDQLYFKEKIGYWEDFLGFHPNSITLEGIFLTGIADVLYEADGNAVTVDSITDIADESVTFTHEDEYGRRLQVKVYDNGFVLLGATYYNIGEEYTSKIINIVKTDGTPESIYVWNEEHSEWHTICIEDEYRENPAPTFKEAIAQRDLYGKLNFTTTVDYYAGGVGTPPPYFTIDRALLLQIYELLYSVDGNIIEFDGEREFHGSTVIFNRQSPYGGKERFLFVYSDGRIGLGFEYYVGEDVTNRIINLIVSGGQPAYGYSWNEEEGIWGKNEPEDPSNGNIGGGVDEYETVDPEELDKINIDVVPTSRFYTIVLHENTKHLNNVLAGFRKEQAAFMKELMKDYQAKYSGVVGASFETAKVVSDGILKVPFVIPKEGEEVSSMRLTYYHESGTMFVTYVIGDISYNFEYCPYLDEYENYGTTTKRGHTAWNGIEFDLYGWENDFYLGKLLYPGLEGQFLQIKMSNVNGDITEVPSLDMFEMLYLVPSSHREIAKLYEEEPVYSVEDETACEEATMIEEIVCE